MEVRLSGHTVYRTEYHIVFVTKYRRRALNPALFRKVVKQVIEEVVDKLEAVELLEISVQPEHVHMMLIIPPRYAVSKVVEIIKSRSAKVVRGRIEWLDKVYYGTRGLWSRGYFVSTVGIDEEVIRHYVKYQQEQDSGQAKLEF